MNKPELSKLNLRLPLELRTQVEAQAHSMGISLNTYVLLALRNFLPYTAGQSRQVSAIPARTAKAPPSASPQQVSRQTPGQGAAPRTGLTWPKVRRNDPCPCGSGIKAKHCHQA